MATITGINSNEVVVAPHTENQGLNFLARTDYGSNIPIHKDDPIRDLEFFYSQILNEQLRALHLKKDDHDLSKAEYIYIDINTSEGMLAISHNISLLKLREKQRLAFHFYRDLYKEIYEYVRARITTGHPSTSNDYNRQSYWKSIVDETAHCQTYRQSRLIARLVAFRQLRRFMPSKPNQGSGLDLEEFAATDSPILNNDEPCSAEKYSFPLINIMRRTTHFPNKNDPECLNFLAQLFGNEEIMHDLEVMDERRRQQDIEYTLNGQNIRTQSGKDIQTQVGFNLFKNTRELPDKIEATNTKANEILDKAEGIFGKTNDIIESAKGYAESVKEKLESFANGFLEKAKGLSTFARRAVEGIAHILIGVAFALGTGRVDNLIQSFVHYTYSLSLKPQDIATFISGLLGSTFNGITAKYEELKNWILGKDAVDKRDELDGPGVVKPEETKPTPIPRTVLTPEEYKYKERVAEMYEKIKILTEEHLKLQKDENSATLEASFNRMKQIDKELRTLNLQVEDSKTRTVIPKYCLTRSAKEDFEPGKTTIIEADEIEDVANAPALGEVDWRKYDTRSAAERKIGEEAYLQELDELRAHAAKGHGLIRTPIVKKTPDPNAEGKYISEITHVPYKPFISKRPLLPDPVPSGSKDKKTEAGYDPLYVENKEEKEDDNYDIADGYELSKNVKFQEWYAETKKKRESMTWAEYRDGLKIDPDLEQKLDDAMNTTLNDVTDLNLTKIYDGNKKLYTEMGNEDEGADDMTYCGITETQTYNPDTNRTWTEKIKHAGNAACEKLAVTTGMRRTNPRQRFQAVCDRNRGTNVVSFVKDTAAKAWSWLSANPLVNLFSGMITFVLSAIIGGERLKTFKPMKMLTSLGNIGRAFKGIDELTKYFGRFWGWCRDKAYNYIYGKSHDEMSIEKKYPKLASVLEIGNYFAGLTELGLLLQQNKKIAFVFLHNYHLASQYIIQAEWHGDRNIAGALKAINTKFTQHIPLADRAVSTRGGQRPAPVIVAFEGRPGCGKTIASHRLIKDIGKRCFPDRAENTLTYHRKPETNFWDGFTMNCKIVALDDFGQIAAYTGIPVSEHMEVIRLGNTDEMQLNMSAIPDKAGTFARPEFVILSSNATSYKCPILTDPDAFIRRLDFNCNVKMKPEFTYRFKTPQLDLDLADPYKISKHMHPDYDEEQLQVFMNSREYVQEICMDIYEFSYPVMQNGTTIYKKVGYNELLEEILKLNDTYKRRHEDDLEIDLPDVVPTELRRFVEVNENNEVFIIDAGLPENFYSKFIGTFARNFSKLFDGNAIVKSVSAVVAGVVVVLPAMIKGLFTVAATIVKKIGSFIAQHWMIISGILAILGGIFFKNVRKCEFKEALQQPSYMKLFEARCCGEYWNRQILPTSCSFCYNYLKKDRPHVHWAEENETMKFNQADLKNYLAYCVDIADFEVNTDLIMKIMTNVPGGWFITSANLLPSSQTLSHDGPEPVEAPRVESYQTRKNKQPRVERSFSNPASCQSGIDDSIMGQINQDLLADDEVQPYLQTQSAIDGNAVDLMRKVITRNMVVLNDAKGHWLHATVLKANFLLVNKHFVHGLTEVNVAPIFGDTVFKKHQITYRHDMTRRGNDVDFVVIGLDRTFQYREDMTKHFISRKEAPYLAGHLEKGCVRMLGSTSMLLGSKNQRVPIIEALTDPQLVTKVQTYDDDRDDYYNLVDVMYGNCNTIKGSCGSLMMCFRPGMQHKFVSVHAAGDKEGVAFSQIFTSEDFDFLKPDIIVVQSLETQAGTLEGIHNVLHLGQLENGGSWMKSHIEPSSLHGIFEVKTKIANLHPGMMLPNLMKVTKPTVTLCEKTLDIAANNVFGTVNQGKRYFCRILTDEEAIKGIETEPYISGVNRATSAGYPYMRLTHGMPGKTKFLGNDKWITNDPLIRTKMATMENNASLGIMDISEGIFMASLKDETRPIEKVDAGKTRVFSSANIVLTLIIRKYFLGFMDHVMRHRILNEIGLGMNVYGHDWELLIKRLEGAGDQIIAGDFSNFDGSLNAQILFRICDVINRWYADEHSRTREVLFRYLIHSVWMVEGKLIQLNHSQPSGNPLTTLINCMYNMFIFRYVYLKLQTDNMMTPTLINYNFFVRGVYYGDDSIISIAKPIIKWYNQETITNMMILTGHEYTDETKQKATRLYKNLNEVTFLKRGFGRVNERNVAQLDKNTITEMVMWKRDTISEIEALRQTTRHAGFEAFMHGEEYFKWFTKKVNRRIDAMGLQSGILTYWEYQHFLDKFMTTIMGDSLLLEEMLMSEY